LYICLKNIQNCVHGKIYADFTQQCNTLQDKVL
jgi:hypothetical protein